MNNRQRLLNGGSQDDDVRRLRRKLSPDLAEVLHMLDALENRTVPDAQSQSISVPAW